MGAILSMKTSSFERKIQTLEVFNFKHLARQTLEKNACLREIANVEVGLEIVMRLCKTSCALHHHYKMRTLIIVFEKM